PVAGSSAGCALAARRRADVHPLTLAAVDAEDFDRLVTGRAEPVKHEPPVAGAGPGPDTRVADRRRADELVEWQVIGLGQGEQQFEARLALPALQPRQRAL